MDICFLWIISRIRSGQSLEGSALILRILFSFDVSDVSGGGSEVVSEFSFCFRMSWLESHLTSSRVSALVADSDIIRDLCYSLVVGSLTFQTLVWRHFSRALDTKGLPDYPGFPEFLEGLLHHYKQRPGKFDSCLLFFSSWDEEDFVRLIPLSPTIFFVQPPFPYVLWGGEENIG